MFNFSKVVQAFRIRNFALYTAGNSLSLIGMWIQRLAVGWLIWELTESGIWLGAIAIAEFIPILLLTPIGGVVADRFDRLRIARIAQVFACLQALSLWALTSYGLITPHILVALTTVAGITNAMNQAARVTLVVNMVPRHLMSTAIALNSIIFNVARIIGPATAGVIIFLTNVSWAFFLIALSYTGLIIVLLIIRMPKVVDSNVKNKSYIVDLKEGIKFTFTHESLAAIIIISATNSLFARPLIDLLPGFAGAVFNAGPSGLAIFTSAMGAGAILASIWLTLRGKLYGLTDIIFFGVAINGITVFIFATCDNFWAAAILLGISGFTQACTGTGTQTLIQSSVDDRLRGRVMSVWLVIGRGGPAFGALIMGMAAEIFGFNLPILVGALISLAGVIIIFPKKNQIAAVLERSNSN